MNIEKIYQPFHLILESLYQAFVAYQEYRRTRYSHNVCLLIDQMNIQKKKSYFYLKQQLKNRRFYILYFFLLQPYRQTDERFFQNRCSNIYERNMHSFNLVRGRKNCVCRGTKYMLYRCSYKRNMHRKKTHLSQIGAKKISFPPKRFRRTDICNIEQHRY